MSSSLKPYKLVLSPIIKCFTKRSINEIVRLFKVVVHAPTGGMGRYRQQQIDVYFSFIGNYTPAGEVISEEERIAQIDAIYEEKKKAKNQRQKKRAKERQASLKERAKTDPEAAAEYEAYLEHRREAGKKRREAEKAKKEADPAYQAQLAEKAAKKAAREKLAYLRKITIAELEELAQSDPEAAEVLQTRRQKTAEKNRKVIERREARMAADLEYAAEVRAKQQASYKKHQVQQKAKRDALIERAKTDPEAAAELEARRAKDRASQNKRNAEKRARAAVDPEYAAEREAFLREKAKKRMAWASGSASCVIRRRMNCWALPANTKNAVSLWMSSLWTSSTGRIRVTSVSILITGRIRKQWSKNLTKWAFSLWSRSGRPQNRKAPTTRRWRSWVC